MLLTGKNPTKGQRRMSTTMTDTDEVAAALQQILAGELPDSIAANATELDQIREAKKAMEKREKVLRDILLNYLDVVSKDSDSNGTVSISRTTHVRKNIDRDLMASLYPKVLAAVEKPTTVTQIRVEVKG